MTTAIFPSEKRPIVVEQLVLYFGTLLAIRGVVAIHQAGAWEVVLALVPILFMYVPVWACSYRGVDPDAYPLAIPAFRDLATWGRSALLGFGFGAVIFVPFIVIYHYWQTVVIGFEYQGIWPSQPLMLIGYHLFFVAIPEEMFYRGYMQSRLDEVWTPRWRVFGAMLGPGWLVTCVFFAFGHSLVVLQWWHFAIIIPSLAFGWMRARTGNVMAGAFFHAWCNITVAFLDTLYGIVPP